MFLDKAVIVTKRLCGSLPLINPPAGFWGGGGVVGRRMRQCVNQPSPTHLRSLCREVIQYRRAFPEPLQSWEWWVVFFEDVEGQKFL